MSRFEKVDLKAMDNSVDCTKLTDSLLPKRWKCPHCYKVQQTGMYGDEILVEFGTYLEHCGNCGYVHCWKLTLTEEFKKNVINLLLGGTI